MNRSKLIVAIASGAIYSMSADVNGQTDPKIVMSCDSPHFTTKTVVLDLANKKGTAHSPGGMTASGRMQSEFDEAFAIVKITDEEVTWASPGGDTWALNRFTGNLAFTWKSGERGVGYTCQRQQKQF
jgi:hypothetical protein